MSSSRRKPEEAKRTPLQQNPKREKPNTIPNNTPTIDTKTETTAKNIVEEESQGKDWRITKLSDPSQSLVVQSAKTKNTKSGDAPQVSEFVGDIIPRKAKSKVTFSTSTNNNGSSEDKVGTSLSMNKGSEKILGDRSHIPISSVSNTIKKSDGKSIEENPSIERTQNEDVAKKPSLPTNNQGDAVAFGEMLDDAVDTILGMCTRTSKICTWNCLGNFNCR